MEDLSPGDMVIILSQMGRRRRRTVPLLKSLSFYICKHKSSLDVKQISDCLFAFTQLSFKVKLAFDSDADLLLSFFRIKTQQRSSVMRWWVRWQRWRPPLSSAQSS